MKTRFVLLLAVAIYAIAVSNAAPTCMLQCMKDVLKCKRDENLGITSEMECCEKYTLCYFMCQPDAESAPPCSSSKGKRGRWNKRAAWDKKTLLDVSNDFDSHVY